ncbi:MAG: DUF2786 domain-containing protein [Parachlamydiaceae bacterium]
MYIYSQKIIQFINEIKDAVKTILSREVLLKVSENRFYDRLLTTSYPIKIVIYNNKTMLGYFNSEFYELGFHECLMHVSKEKLYNVIRHELAHYITFIYYGPSIQPHAAEFRAFCERIGWGKEIYNASFCLDEEQSIPNIEENSVFRKVQKLLALATSSNQHEAEQAMIKSQQLLLKHNIESKYIGGEEEEKVFLKRIIKQKKENSKMNAIGAILETFFVATVYHRSTECTYLEIVGNAVNIEIAEHVALVLQSELDKMWDQTKKTANLKGALAKNSFFRGLARGYCNKIQALKREYPTDVTNALMVIEKKLENAKSMVYERLSSSKSRVGICHQSSALGEALGRQMNINPALHRSSKNSEALIGYSG